MEVTAMVDTVVAMAATVDTTARGLLMPRPLLMLSPAMVTTATDTVMDTAMVAMDMVAATDTTARGLLMLRLSPLLMPNLAMVMAMVVVMEATAMVDTVVDMADTVATTARGLLMLSPAMDTTAVDMVAMDMAAATDTAMAMATTDKKLCVMQFRVQYKN